MRDRGSLRLVLGTLAAMGALGAATAAVAQSGDSIAGVACEVISTTGDAENMQPNYRAAANRAEFSLLARMRQVADDVLLYATDQGGEMTSGLAALKGVLVRDENGAFGMETLQIYWPFTVLKHDGQLYNVIQMAHDQQVPIGLSLSAGGNPLGDIEFVSGQFDPNSPVVGFDSATATAIHQALLRNEGFSARLMAGGDVFSTIEPDTATYKTFIENTLIPAMDEAKRQDAEDPCTFVDPQAILDSITF